MNEQAPPGFRWSTNEYGQILVPVKRKQPEGSLKKRCRAAFEVWKRQHPETPARLLKYTVGNFKSEAGKLYAIGTPGTGDILVGICGTTLMVETKALTGRQKTSQEEMQADWIATGQPYVMPRTVAEFIGALDDIVRTRGTRF